MNIPEELLQNLKFYLETQIAQGDLEAERLREEIRTLEQEREESLEANFTIYPPGEALGC